MASSLSKQGTTPSPRVSENSVYHERQSRWRCGLHAVNALLRHNAFTPGDFEEIADSLLMGSYNTWFHPHRSVFGMGDYDANVLLAALGKKGLSATWVSNKDDLRAILGKESLTGFLVNVEVKDLIHRILELIMEKGRHWVAVARYPDGFFLVDSRAHSPSKFRSEGELLDYLEQVRANIGHVLAIERPPPEAKEQ